MKHKKHMGKSVAALALALVLLTGQVLPVLAVTWADVNDLKDDASALNSQKAQLESKLEELADDKSKALERRELLDQKIGVLVTQINNAQQQMIPSLIRPRQSWKRPKPRRRSSMTCSAVGCGPWRRTGAS